MKSLVFEIPDWRDPPGYSWPITVETVLSDLKKFLGHIPERLENEQAIRTFANAASIPMVDADIERDIDFPHPRWASRKYVQEQYLAWHAWAQAEGWLEAAPPAGGGPDDKKKAKNKKERKGGRQEEAAETAAEVVVS